MKTSKRRKANRKRRPGTSGLPGFKPAWQLILLVVLVLLGYLHTLDVPFYYDDYSSIRYNTAIQASGLPELWQYAAERFVGYLTFAVNYAIHGYALPGYHLVNIAVHGMASITVYYLAAVLLTTPAMRNAVPDRARLWLPLVAALLFALHPLQTQAVTYIVQRLASLSALFYLLALVLYARTRLAIQGGNPGHGYLLFVLAAVLAFFTKQNTYTLPLAVLLMEICFFEHPSPIRKKLLGAFLGLVAVGVTLLLAADHLPLLSAVSAMTRETETVSRLAYFMVQWKVLWIYLLTFLVPVNQRLNFNIAAPDTLLDPGYLALGVAHLVVLAVATVFIRRAPLLCFGILFYYLAHAVESGLIPISDFGYEHRTYLPNAGPCLAAGWLATVVLPRFLHRRVLAPGAMVIVVSLLMVTWHRNDLWRDQVAFYEHELKVSPDSFRAMSMLGEAWYVRGDVVKAVEIYRRAQPLFDSRVDRDNNIEEAYFTNYAATLQEAGYFEQANTLIDELMMRPLSPAMEAKLRVTRGNVHAINERFAAAESEFNQARQLDPGNIDAVASLAKLKLATNDLRASYSLFQELYAMDPLNRDANIGMDYFRELYGEE